MWIRVQNKQRIINSDHIIDIFVDKTGSKIFAETTRDGDFFELGCYKNRNECNDILDVIMIVGAHKDVTFLQLPLGGDVRDWLEDSHRLAEKIYNK